MRASLDAGVRDGWARARLFAAGPTVVVGGEFAFGVACGAAACLDGFAGGGAGVAEAGLCGLEGGAEDVGRFSGKVVVEEATDG